MKISATAALLLLLTGCAAPDGPPSPAAGSDEAGLPTGLRFSEARAVIDIPNTGHETFVQVSADGQVLLACAHGDFRTPAHMYVSTDGGASFRELAPGLGWPVAGDCDVALADDGLWAFAGKTELGVTVATTRDAGQAWTVNHLAAPPLNGLADRQWLDAVGSSLVLTYQPGTQQVGPILVTRSTDAGATWSQPVEAAAMDPAAPATTVGHFAQTAGRLLLPLSRSDLQSANRFALLASDDGGSTWREHPAFEVTRDAYPTGLAATDDGRLAWAFVAEGRLLVARSWDAGLTWDAPREVATGVAWDRPWASMRPDASVDVVWMSDGSQFGAGPGLALSRVHADPLAEPEQTLVAAIGFLEFASVAHDDHGLAHVAVVDAPRLISADPDLTGEATGRLLLVQETPAGS